MKLTASMVASLKRQAEASGTYAAVNPLFLVDLYDGIEDLLAEVDRLARACQEQEAAIRDRDEYHAQVVAEVERLSRIEQAALVVVGAVEEDGYLFSTDLLDELRAALANAPAEEAEPS